MFNGVEQQKIDENLINLKDFKINYKSEVKINKEIIKGNQNVVS